MLNFISLALEMWKKPLKEINLCVLTQNIVKINQGSLTDHLAGDGHQLVSKFKTDSNKSFVTEQRLFDTKLKECRSYSPKQNYIIVENSPHKFQV